MVVNPVCGKHPGIGIGLRIIEEEPRVPVGVGIVVILGLEGIGVGVDCVKADGRGRRNPIHVKRLNIYRVDRIGLHRKAPEPIRFRSPGVVGYGQSVIHRQRGHGRPGRALRGR